ncbi:MAG: sugar transferase [Winogradskyella sp.]|uniref:sugar transferase n=1 Tax=Winogradskyella sp. TaxID=1883156 RepID=UPI00385A7C92
MITKSQLQFKRAFDLVTVLLFLPILVIPIFILILISSIETRQFGLFSQNRVGQHAKVFKIYKIRTLKEGQHRLGSLVMHATKIGKFLRKSKLDELPQLYNILIGDMSFVGPRPDLIGFADKLKGEDRIILKVKPGITGSATLKYVNEERVLERQKDPDHYNRAIIWVDKVKINKKYVMNYTFYLDLKLILKTIFKK